GAWPRPSRRGCGEAGGRSFLPRPGLGLARVPEGLDLGRGPGRMRIAEPSHAVLDVTPDQYGPSADPQRYDVGGSRLALLGGRGIPEPSLVVQNAHAGPVVGAGQGRAQRALLHRARDRLAAFAAN